MFDGFAWEHLLPLAKGAVSTIALCVVSGVLGTVLGLLLGLGRTSPSRIARWICAIYVNAVRGVPLLVIIFFMYFGIPLFWPTVDLSTFVTGVIALTGFAAAYIAEIFRGSIEAVPRGQGEAAEALGLGYYAKYRFVILPQALKIAVPPGISFLIALVKDSSLVAVIGFVELTKAGTIVSNLTGDPLTTYLIVAGLYFVICYGISVLGRRYEARVGVRRDPLTEQPPLRLGLVHNS